MSDEKNELQDRPRKLEASSISSDHVERVSRADAARSSCPSEKELNEILSGDKIDSGLAEHLSHCQICQQTLDRISGDSPLNELRTRFDPSGAVATWLEPNSGDGGLGTLAGFRIESQIAVGGMGVIYRGFDRRLGRKVAIKVLSRFDHPDAAERFLLETQAVAKLQHDHIVPVYESGLARDSRPYLVMPLVEGETLAQRIRRAPLEPRESATIVRQIALALQAVHEAGLIHRDIKPANILLDSLNGRARLTDFGLVRRVGDDPFASTDRLAGTPEYMSPEQASGTENIDQKSDIFNLGINLYECLTGTVPFRGAPHAVVRLAQESLPTPPRKLDPGIPKDLESICLKAMSLEPSQRYLNGNEFAADLQRFLDGRPTFARPVSAWNRSLRWIKRNPRLATMGIALGIALTTLFFGTLISSVIFSKKNQQLVESQREADFARLQRIIVASPSLLPLILDSGELNQNYAIPFLKEVVSSENQEYQSRINAAVALSEIGQPQIDMLVEAVTSAPPQPEQCGNLVRGLRQYEASQTALKTAFNAASNDQDLARIAVVAFHLGIYDPIEKICARNDDPETRTTLIHLLPDFHGRIDEIEQLLKSELSENAKYALSMSLSLFKTEEFPSSTTKRIIAALQGLLETTKDSGVRSAAIVAIRHWGGTPLEKSVHKSDELPWRELNPDLCLIRIPASTQILGRTTKGTTHDDHQPHEVRLTRDFWIADRETSTDLYQKFLDDLEYSEELKPKADKRRKPDSPPSLNGSHPVQRVSWFDAALFCNWLSQRNGRKAYYQFKSIEDLEPNQDSPKDDQVRYSAEWLVTFDSTANGFRLPTMAQWEMASRAGSSTDFFFGSDFRLFENYSRFSSARTIPTAPCGSSLPNRYGLHETLGNVWEWCENWHEAIGPDPLVDPKGPDQPDPNRIGKSFMGGGVQTTSGEPISGSRGFTHPDNRFGNLGFRVSLPN